MSSEIDPLDRFIPHPDVRERFEITIRAPAGVVMAEAVNFDLQSPPLVRAIFRLRERLMGSAPATQRRAQGLLAETAALGWGLLAEQPDRRVVCGATCQPWLADVKFTAISPERFADFAAPGQVKIAWTLEAEPLDPVMTRFGQETRVVATDAAALEKFRHYWRWARFGIVGVRLLLLPAVRRAAQRRWASESRRR